MIEYPDGMVYNLPNCGIVAMATCSGKPYEHTREWFRRRMKARGNWKGRTYHTQYSEYLRECGVWFKHSKCEKGDVPTLMTFVTLRATPGRLYAVRVSGHVMTCRNGWVMDQIQRCPVGEHYSRRRRVTDYWEIFE